MASLTNFLLVVGGPIGAQFGVEIEFLVATVFKIGLFASGLDIGFVGSGRLAAFAAASPATSATTPTTAARATVAFFLTPRFRLTRRCLKRQIGAGACRPIVFQHGAALVTFACRCGLRINP